MLITPFEQFPSTSNWIKANCTSFWPLEFRTEKIFLLAGFGVIINVIFDFILTKDYDICAGRESLGRFTSLQINYNIHIWSTVKNLASPVNDLFKLARQWIFLFYKLTYLGCSLYHDLNFRQFSKDTNRWTYKNVTYYE